MLNKSVTFSIYNRYITEDIPVGCHLYYQLAKKFNVRVPVIESMITLGSVMTKMDYWKESLTLEDLGIAHLTREELLVYLREGKYSG
jgi:opine dehydrogenase